MTPATDETPKPPRWRRWAVEIGIFVAVFFAIQAWMARDVPAGPAPDFATVAADGRALSLAEWRATHPGEAVGVYFWADWCPICTAQQGTIEGVQADYPVLTVAMQSGGAAAVKSVLAERGLDWTTAIDADGRIAQTYGLRGVPAFIRSDNGPEFIAQAVRDRIAAAGARTADIEPGSPWDGGGSENSPGDCFPDDG